MIRNVVGFAAGLIFGLGLAVSHMVNPKKVLDFLDFAGAWDPSLVLVMGAAVAVTFAAWRISLGRKAPMFAAMFHVPGRRDFLDRRLIGGALVFGAGWGMVGFCPGPAISSLAYLAPQSAVFVAALVAGSALARFLPSEPMEILGTPAPGTPG